MGAFAAYANGESLEKSRNEINQTVSTLRKRLKARADEVRRKAAAEAALAAAQESEENTGQEDGGELKRAAM